MASAYRTVPTPSEPPRGKPVDDDGDLDRRTHQPDRTAREPVQARHQAVARARGRSARRCTGPVAAPLSTIPATISGDPRRQAVHIRQRGQRRVHRDADTKHVGDGAEARALPQRDPQQQHGRADDGQTTPMDRPVRSASPWCSTFHGSSPSPARTSSAELAPYSARPHVELGQPPGEPGTAAGTGDCRTSCAPCVVVVACCMSLCGWDGAANHGQSGEGGLICMAQWTSAVGAAQLARLLRLPAGPPPGARHAQARPPTAPWPTASGCSSWRAASRSPRGCPPNGSSPSPCPSAGPPSPRRTRRCAREGFLESRRGAGQLDRRPGGQPAARARASNRCPRSRSAP